MYAGTTVEALRDGPLPDVWLAQPSGLSVSADGARLWIADSETSALRYIEDGVLHTAVGQGLFDFGHVDGPAERGAAAAPAGRVRAAGRLGAGRRHVQRRGAPLRPGRRPVSTVADGLAEPSDIVLDRRRRRRWWSSPPRTG